MFFCGKCANKNEWPYSGFKSYGRCEVCGKSAECNDVPSAYLPTPVRKTKPEPEPEYSALEMLAIKMHSGLCTYNHTDGCGWYYEIHGTVHDWVRYAHHKYLQKADRLIVQLGETQAKRAVEMYFLVKDI